MESRPEIMKFAEDNNLSYPAARAAYLRMEMQRQWAEKMMKALTQFSDAAESAWKLLEGYGVTLDKLEEVKMAIYEGSMTRREGWAYLGLPAAEFPE